MLRLYPAFMISCWIFSLVGSCICDFSLFFILIMTITYVKKLVAYFTWASWVKAILIVDKIDTIVWIGKLMFAANTF